jgi:hypothetical protein
VATKLLHYHDSWWLPDAPTFVKSAIKTVGIAEVTNGYYMHTLNCYFVKTLDYLLPFFWADIYLNILWSFDRKIHGNDLV